MPTVTVPRTDLSTEEVVAALREGLGAGYNVLPGMTMGQLPFQGPREGRPNQIVVGTGDNRQLKALVTITPQGGQTKLRIRPSGITLTLVLNTWGIARKVRGVLASSPSLSAR
ncbi:MAG: hypothetical protein ACRDP5_22315 [Streptosporangiaceae bacterium]